MAIHYFKSIELEARNIATNVSARFLAKCNAEIGMEIYPVWNETFTCLPNGESYKTYLPNLSGCKPVGMTFETPIGRR